MKRHTTLCLIAVVLYIIMFFYYVLNNTVAERIQKERLWPQPQPDKPGAFGKTASYVRAGNSITTTNGFSFHLPFAWKVSDRSVPNDPFPEFDLLEASGMKVGDVGCPPTPKGLDLGPSIVARSSRNLVHNGKQYFVEMDEWSGYGTTSVQTVSIDISSIDPQPATMCSITISHYPETLTKTTIAGAKAIYSSLR